MLKIKILLDAIRIDESPPPFGDDRLGEFVRRNVSNDMVVIDLSIVK